MHATLTRQPKWSCVTKLYSTYMVSLLKGICQVLGIIVSSASGSVYLPSMVSITFSIRLAFFCHVPISTKLLATGKVMSPVPHMTSCSSIRELPFLWFIFHYKLSLYPVMDRQSQMSVGDKYVPTKFPTHSLPYPSTSIRAVEGHSKVYGLKLAR